MHKVSKVKISNSVLDDIRNNEKDYYWDILWVNKPHSVKNIKTFLDQLKILFNTNPCNVLLICAISPNEYKYKDHFLDVESYIKQIFTEEERKFISLLRPETSGNEGADNSLNLDSVSSYDEALKCATALISYMKVNIHLSNGKLGRDVIDDTQTLKEKMLMTTSLFEVLESIGHKMEKARLKFNADAQLYKIKLDEGKPVDEAFEALDPKEEEKEEKLPMVKKTKPTDPSKKVENVEELEKETPKTEDKNMKLAVEEKKEVKEIAEEISSLENSNPFQQIANIRKK